jgi:putative endonuclease
MIFFDFTPMLFTNRDKQPQRVMKYSKRKALGIWGEQQAMRFLVANGYRVIATNYTFGRCEVDIIVDKNDTLIFVEVKTRSSLRFGYPEEFVTDAQLERIRTVVQAFCTERNYTGERRIDIISVSKGPPFELSHFEGVVAVT